MNMKFKRLMNISLICFLVFGLCACSHTKSEKEIDKILKEKKVSYTERPYYDTEDPYVEIRYNMKTLVYQKEKYKYYDWDINYKKYDLHSDKLNSKIKKSFEKFSSDLDLTQENLESYLKNKYDTCVKKYKKLSYKEKIIYANSLESDVKKEYNNFLKNKTEKEAEEIYNWMLEKYKTPNNCTFFRVEGDYYLHFEAPEELEQIADRLSNLMKKNKNDKKEFNFYQKKVKDGETNLYFFTGDDYFAGYYVFCYKDDQIQDLSVLCYRKEPDFTEQAFAEYSAYLIKAAENVETVQANGIAYASTETIECNGYMHLMSFALNDPVFMMYKTSN